MRNRHLSKLAILAVLLAAVLLYCSLRGIDWKQVGAILLSARPGPLTAGYLLASAALFLRSHRWRVLLNAGAPISISLAFWATAAGYFGNNFLPARAGELLRTFMVASRSPLKRAYVLTTALSERVADALALVVIAGLALSFLPHKPDWLARVSWGFAGVGAVGVLGVALLPFMETLGLRLLEKLPLPQKIRSPAQRLTQQIAQGLRALHSPRRLVEFLTCTAVIWCVDGAAAMALGRALNLNISFPVAMLLIASLGLGSALPSAPGYVGIYQFVAVSVLTPFGFTRAGAIAFIILAQAISYLIVGVWGAIGFSKYNSMTVTTQHLDTTVKK